MAFEPLNGRLHDNSTEGPALESQTKHQTTVPAMPAWLFVKQEVPNEFCMFAKFYFLEEWKPRGMRFPENRELEEAKFGIVQVRNIDKVAIAFIRKLNPAL